MASAENKLKWDKEPPSDSFSMSETTDKNLGINSWLEDELYQQYLHDRQTVDESWKKIFDSNGTVRPVAGNGARVAPAPSPVHQPAAGEELVPLRGPALRLAENMTA